MLNCSRFKSVKNTTPSCTVPLVDVLNEIKSDMYKEVVGKIRAEEIPAKSDLKFKLPVFTPTSVFSYRSIAGHDEYNGVICLDIDGVEYVEELKKRAVKLNYVHAAFITASGSGLKVIIKTNATKETYKAVEIEVANYFYHDAGGIRDVHCKDIARIQYVSYDTELYYNENSKTLNF